MIAIITPRGNVRFTFLRGVLLSEYVLVIGEFLTAYNLIPA